MFDKKQVLDLIQDQKPKLLDLGKIFYNNFGRGALIFEIQPEVQTQTVYGTEQSFHNDSSLTPEQQQWVINQIQSYDPNTQAVVVASVPPAQEFITTLIEQ